MKKQLIRAFVVAVVVAGGLATPTVRAFAEEVAAFCYEFPGGITVCCDGGGCYIKGQ